MVRHDPDSGAISLLDSGGTENPQVIQLRPDRSMNAVAARRILLQKQITADTLVFHNFAGMAMLGGSIPHRRSVLYLHTNSADVFELLPQRVEFLDAILASGSDLARELRRLPACTVSVTPLEYPLSEKFFNAAGQKKEPGLVLGYSGRLDADQKRVGRLVELAAQLAALGINYRLEIAGGGPEEAGLRQKLADRNVRFLGRLDERQMSTAYGGWDFLVCTSDYETGPLVALEAMAAGVPPIMPDIPCQATELLRQNKFPQYPRGDMAAAAALIRDLVKTESGAEPRNQIRQLVADRKPEAFIVKLLAELEKIELAPSRSRRMPTPRGLPEWLPFGLRSRLPGRNTFLK
jgi:glycosyltransferase involved in cell wall biosynthesis